MHFSTPLSRYLSHLCGIASGVALTSSVLSFALTRDWRHVALCLIPLALLGYETACFVLGRRNARMHEAWERAERKAAMEAAR